MTDRLTQNLYNRPLPCCYSEIVHRNRIGMVSGSMRQLLVPVLNVPEILQKRKCFENVGPFLMNFIIVVGHYINSLHWDMTRVCASRLLRHGSASWCFAFVSRNEVADLKSDIIVVCSFISLAMPTTSCKQTWLIDDVMWIDINFTLG